jgi:cytochrome c biogenesis protein
MISIYVSFFNYSQLWFVETNDILNIGGKSNRAILFFQEEFRKILKQTKKQTL